MGTAVRGSNDRRCVARAEEYQEYVQINGGKHAKNARIEQFLRVFSSMRGGEARNHRELRSELGKQARRRQVKAVNSQLMVQQTIRKPQTAMIGHESDHFAMQDGIPQHRRQDTKWEVTEEK